MIDGTVSLPLIESNDFVVFLFLGLLGLFFLVVLGSLILPKLEFLDAFFAVFIFGMVGMIVSLVGMITAGIITTIDMDNARRESVESALSARVLDGDLMEDGIILVETNEGIQRMTFSLYEDAGVMLLTPIGGLGEMGGIDE